MDEASFTALTEPYRRQLHVHCYRMLGSFDDADDLVQETLMRAWKGRAQFEGRSMVRTWLYRIATNACLDFLERKSRRVLSLESPQATEPNAVDWIQPYPDRSSRRAGVAMRSSCSKRKWSGFLIKLSSR